MSRIVGVFLFMAIAALIIAVVGIVWFISIHGFAPETAALITAWATIVSVVLAQVVTARLAAERAHVDALLADDQAQAATLQAYLQEMGQVLLSFPSLSNLPEAGTNDPEPSANDPEPSINDIRVLARAHTLTVLRGLTPARKQIVFEYLSDTNLLETILKETERASLRKEMHAEANARSSDILASEDAAREPQQAGGREETTVVQRQRSEEVAPQEWCLGLSPPLKVKVWAKDGIAIAVRIKSEGGRETQRFLVGLPGASLVWVNSNTISLSPAPDSTAT